MDITFGEYVRQKRLERKITLRTFAKQVGISATFISGMENNEKSAPSDEVLKSIAELLVLDRDETDRLYDLAARTKHQITYHLTLRKPFVKMQSLELLCVLRKI